MCEGKIFIVFLPSFFTDTISFNYQLPTTKNPTTANRQPIHASRLTTVGY